MRLYQRHITLLGLLILNFIVFISFLPQNSNALQEYLTQTYFRHYRLYKHIFTAKPRLTTSIAYTPSRPAHVNA